MAYTAVFTHRYKMYTRACANQNGYQGSLARPGPTLSALDTWPSKRVAWQLDFSQAGFMEKLCVELKRERMASAWKAGIDEPRTTGE